MTSSPDDLDEALAHITPRIIQPELRPLQPNERVVRTAGLKFILPMNWKPGDVLDERSAALLNTAYCTAVINRFAPIRQELLSRDDCTYEMLDKALQDHFENFTYNPRTTDASKPETTSEEDRELIAFARPHFNKAFGGQGLERKAYELLLREYVATNRDMLTKLKAEADKRFDALATELEAVFGE